MRRAAAVLWLVALCAVVLALYFGRGAADRPTRYARLGQGLVALEDAVTAQEQKVAAAFMALDDDANRVRPPEEPENRAPAYQGLLRAARNATLGSVPAAMRSVELGLREAFSEGGLSDARRITEELSRVQPVEQRLDAQIQAFFESIGSGTPDADELRSRRDQMIDSAREAREIAANCMAMFQASWPRALDASAEQLAERQLRFMPALIVALLSLIAAAIVSRRDHTTQRDLLGSTEEALRASGVSQQAAETQRDQLRQSERRASLELALLRLEQLSLTESLRSSLIICDTALVARLINSAARKRFAIDDASIDLPLVSLTGLQPVLSGMGGGDALERAIANSRPIEVAEIEVQVSGGSFWLYVRATPYVDEAGHVRGLIVLADDITQQIETRNRLMQTERLAAMGRLSAQVTHEIRNPLSAIALNVDLLADELAEAAAKEELGEAKQLLAAISREVERLTEVTGEYLRLSRLRPPSMHPEELSGLIRELTEFLGEDLRRRHITLDLRLPDPSPRVVADAAQLRQALMNIFKNSMESMPEGGRMEVTIDRQDGKAVLEVADNGVGIPEHVLARIFDPFYTTKEGGSGLGLPITQQIVAEHGGEVSAESRTGHGTKVRVVLPAA